MDVKRHVVLVLAVVLLLFHSGDGLAEERVLKRDVQGADVTEIQELLDSLGYQLFVDGKYGPETEAAVHTFQQDSGLLADGITGEETRKALYSLGQNRVHKVEPGNCLSVLAVFYGTTVADIMAANDLTDDTIYSGQKLIIPAKSFRRDGSVNSEDEPKDEQGKGSPIMLTYQVQSGDSTYVIAKRFNTDVEAIAKTNNLHDPALIKAGQRLLVPSPSGTGREPDFAWPVTGRISSGYGWRTHPIYKNRQFHGGVDIAVGIGTTVTAAAHGIVVRAGDMDGFGLGIVINHGNGITSWYGHNSRLLVKVGDQVLQGQPIARSGNSGVSTGPHVDFRIKIDGKTVNPLSRIQ